MKAKNNKKLIVSDGCCVQYGDTLALDNVSFSVSKGKKVAVVGPNGGGKSTLFNAMTGLVPLANGSIKIYGEDPEGSKKENWIHTAKEFNQLELSSDCKASC